MIVLFSHGEILKRAHDLERKQGFLMVRMCSTILSEVLNWYCYENPKDLSVAMSHRNYSKKGMVTRKRFLG